MGENLGSGEDLPCESFLRGQMYVRLRRFRLPRPKHGDDQTTGESVLRCAREVSGPRGLPASARNDDGMRID